jgi:hypothetical protein
MNPQDYNRQAEECEREAATCAPGSNRDLLLNVAAQWRRLAAEAATEGSLSIAFRDPPLKA